MDKKSLLDCTARELLEKFGQGSHKPGSGSAVAYQGMLAAQLIHTVISITNEEKYRAKYAGVLPELLKRDYVITSTILPSLEDLFQRDALLFDKVIQLRRQRDKETNVIKQEELRKAALEALRPATEILVEIGNYCADLTDHGLLIFDVAYRSAKGDSGVAMTMALGALAGCLSIIDLNLSYFGSDEWTVTIREKLEVLKVDYQGLVGETTNRMKDFSKQSIDKSFRHAKVALTAGLWEGVTLSGKAIESIANQVTNLLTDYRDLLWDGKPPTNPYEILKPEVILEKVLEYKFGFVPIEIYEEGGVTFQVAGMINKKEKIVSIARGLAPEVTAFTIAHELGHALLHTDLAEMHRDRAIDGSAPEADLREKQANTFAACFLMPARMLVPIFQQVFSIERFEINQHTVFKFYGSSVAEFKRRHPTRRHVSNFVAKYKGKTYQPLYKVFGVSVTAMAIRLEELGLVVHENF